LIRHHAFIISRSVFIISFMSPLGNLFIPVAHGRLEAILKEQAARFAEPRGAALVLHPHPLHGGTMHNKVVYRAARALNEAGLISLRINFRGVGLSTGAHAFGEGEQDDARAALDYLAEKYPRLPITLAGFSFGSRVGLKVGVSRPSVVRLIGIGLPARMYDFSFLRQCRKPLLLVHGARDTIAPPDPLPELIKTIPPEAHAELVMIPDADHFFAGHLDEFEAAIRNWMEKEILRTTKD
jgi:alpha/beta superfamily hydrolase